MLNKNKGMLQKPWWKVLAVALAFMVVAITSVLPVVSAAAESDIEAMKNSSVRVLITQGGRLLGKGSGFVIDDGKHIVTNYHVVEAVEKGSRGDRGGRDSRDKRPDWKKNKDKKPFYKQGKKSDGKK